MKIISIILLQIAFPITLFAARFETSYLTIDLPKDWQCLRNDSVWSCRNTIEPIKKQMLLVMTAKKAGTSDTSAGYFQLLSQPKIMRTQKNNMVQSKVLWIKNTPIAQDTWVFALHENSEVENFYTYYLATSKDRVGVVVALNVHKDSYKSHEKLIQSLLYSIRLKDLNTISKNQQLAQTQNTPGSSFNDDEVKLQQTQTMGESGLGGLSHWPKEKLAILVLSGLAIVFAVWAILGKK